MGIPHADQLVEIELDQPRRLFFNLRALRALDRSMGQIGISKVLDLVEALNFEALERTLWAGMLFEEPSLALATAVKRLDDFVDGGGSVVKLFPAAYKAVSESNVFTKQNQVPQGEARPEQATN